MTEMEKFTVVVNHEEQYSIWSLNRPVPDGWRETGFEGEREACLQHIATVWTDMRPLSLRQRMQAIGGSA